MWRAAPAKAAKISGAELSQYRSKASLNGGGRPLAIACAIRLACSSVGEDFGWVRLIEAPPRIICHDSRKLVAWRFSWRDVHAQDENRAAARKVLQDRRCVVENYSGVLWSRNGRRRPRTADQEDCVVRGGVRAPRCGRSTVAAGVGAALTLSRHANWATRLQLP